MTAALDKICAAHTGAAVAAVLRRRAANIEADAAGAVWKAEKKFGDRTVVVFGISPEARHALRLAVAWHEIADDIEREFSPADGGAS